jgi:hypothetical protein
MTKRLEYHSWQAPGLGATCIARLTFPAILEKINGTVGAKRV